MKIHHTPRILVGIFAVFTVSAMLACFAFSSTASALQTVPYKMNFQGRLTDTSGNAMANGTYNMKFRIYDALTAGTQQWTEQRSNFTSTGVTVTNGLFSVQLGDVTSLPVSIFTNQNLYFEIELPTPGTATCSTSACESYTEGPMGPRNKLGTSAYAFNSDTLDGIDSASFGQLGTSNTWTNTNTISVTSATALKVQNASSVSVLTADTSTNLRVQVGSATTDATAIFFLLDQYNQVADPTGTAGAMYYNTNSNKFRCYQNTSWTDCIGSGSGVTTVGAFTGASIANGASISGSTITFGAADGTNPGLVTTGTQTFTGSKTFNGIFGVAGDFTITGNTGENFSVQADTSYISTNGNTIVGGTTLQGGATSALVVQDGGGTNYLKVDTTNNRISVGAVAADATGVTLVLDTKNTAGDPAGIVGAMYYNSNLGKFRCYQGVAWTDCVGAGGSSTLQSSYTTSTGGTTPSVKVDSTRGGVSIQDADTTIGGSLFAVNGSNAAGLGSNLLSVSSNGQVKMGNQGTATGQVYVSGTLPSLVSTVSTSNAVGFGMSGKYGFVSMNAPGFLQSVDLTNPASPVTLSTVSITAPTAVAVSNNYAYVANGNNITVVDISNPSSMVIKGTLAMGTPISSLTVHGKYLYGIAKSFSQMKMIDISNPATPINAITFTIIANADSIEIQGEYAYVGSRSGGVIQAYDISTSTPTALGSSVALTGVSHMSAYGRYLYAVSSTSTAGKIFDISNPALITNPSAITLSANAMGVIASGNYLYVPESGKFEVFDITTPSTATSLGATTVSTFGIGSIYTDQSIVMSGRYSYVLERGNGGVKTFDMGGVYTSALQSGSLEASQVSVNQSIGIGKNASIAGSLNVGAGASIFGDIAVTGDAQYKSNTNSATAFRVQNATNGNIFVADTSNSRIYIGDPTPDATAVVFVVDNASGTTDPTGVNGAMYYNTTIGKFRCYEFNIWKNCTGSSTNATGSSTGQVLAAGSANYLSGSGFQIPTTVGLQAGQTVSWRVTLSKSAAGTAASSFIVYTGINGTTADTARCTLGTGAGTAVTDNAVAIVSAYVSASGATAVLQCSVQIVHGNATQTTGFIITPMVSAVVASSAFDSTPASTKVGLGLTTGASVVPTVTSVYTTTTNF